MEDTGAFLIYAGIYRLAVIAAGTVCVVLGYRLFARGVYGSTDLEGGFGETQLKVKNAAPGTCFALFGVAIIIAMLIDGSPELTVTQLQDIAQASESKTVTTVRGGEGQAAEFDELVSAGDLKAKAGDTAGAIAAYVAALGKGDVPLAEAASPIAATAALILDDGRPHEALTLIRLAISIDDDDPEFFRTLIAVLIQTDQRAEAMKAAEHAAERWPDHAGLTSAVDDLRSHTR